MVTTPHDLDTTSPTEAIALANCVVLGVAIWLNGPVPWPAVRGASAVIMYAFATSVALTAAARAGAHAAAALGFLTSVLGAAIGVPYVIRTGFSPTGLAVISTLGSGLATLSVGILQVAHLRSSSRPLRWHLSCLNQRLHQ